MLLFSSIILAFRLITLDSLYSDPSHSDLFIMNKDSKMKISRINPENLPLFYTVIHSRKIFFYTRGNYYSLGYSEDGVSLKLSPVNMGKVEFFTQENEEDVRKIKIMRWDDLIKKAREKGKEEKDCEENKGCEEKKVESKVIEIKRSKTDGNKMNDRRLNDRRVDDRKMDDRRMDDNRYSSKIDEGYNNRINDKYSIKIDEKYSSKMWDSSPYNKINDEKSHYNNLNDDPKFKLKIHSPHEIESDSEMIDSKSLNIKIDTVDPHKKTFFLKNDNDMCVTYFRKSFVFAECKNRRRQVFRIIGMEEILDKVKKIDEEKKESKNVDFIKEIEDESSVDGNVISNKEGVVVKRGGTLKKANLKNKTISKPIVNVDTKPTINVDTNINVDKPVEGKDEETIEQEEIIESTEQSPVQNRPIMKKQPTLYEFCRNLLNKNFGRIETLPLNCINVLGINLQQPNILQQNNTLQQNRPGFTPQRAIFQPRRLPPLKITKTRIIKRKVIPTKKIESTTKTEASEESKTGKSLNVIERLQKALGQEAFD